MDCRAGLCVCGCVLAATGENSPHELQHLGMEFCAADACRGAATVSGATQGGSATLARLAGPAPARSAAPTTPTAGPWLQVWPRPTGSLAEESVQPCYTPQGKSGGMTSTLPPAHEPDTAPALAARAVARAAASKQRRLEAKAVPRRRWD